MKKTYFKVLACTALLTAGMSVRADRTETSLSGSGWTADGQRVCVPHTWNGKDGADGGYDSTKSITSCSAASYERKRVTYARALPNPTAGKRQFLHFGGVSINAIVRVNGVEVGRHAGAFTAFCFEVTKHLKATGNTLEVVADNRYDATVPPIVGDFTMYGGLYRDVTWLETDPVCIDPCVYAGPGVEVLAATRAGHLSVRTHVSGAADAKVTYAICGRTYATDEFDVPGVSAWSPETPHLYELVVTVEKGGSRDCVVQNIGFRDAEFRADGFYLNGQKRQMRGVCRHQDQANRGWALSPDDEAVDMAWIKRMGADATRGSHYPQSTHWYDLCDRKGLMAWCEVPFVNELEFTDAFRSNMTQVAREMIAQRRNHPSIVCWGLFNELYSCSKKPRGTFEPILVAVRDEMKTLDPTRGIVAASNRLGMKSLNQVPEHVTFNVYPGWYSAKPEGVAWYFQEFAPDDTQMTRLLEKLRTTNDLPLVGVGEYGAGAVKGIHGDMFREAKGKHLYSEEYQAGVHYVNYRSIRRDAKTWGSFVWEMFDSGSDARQETGGHGINNKGLVTFDRQEPKEAYWFYKANWNAEPMIHAMVCARNDAGCATIAVFCNTGKPVALTVGEKRLEAKMADEVKTALWFDVPLTGDVVAESAGLIHRVAVPFCDEKCYNKPMQKKLEELNRRYGAPGRIVFRTGFAGYPNVVLANRFGTAEVALLGANVLSYRPTGHAPVVFRPAKKDADYNRGDKFHGGIPVCWPQFGNRFSKELPGHGFAAKMLFEVKATEYSEEMTEITLVARDSEATRALWPHAFGLEVKISVSMKLNLAMTTRNTGKEAFDFSCGFHPYFVVRDRSAVTLRGMDGFRYTDVSGETPKTGTWSGDVKVDFAPDHVFELPTAPKHEFAILDPGLRRAIALAATGNTRQVLWNPGTAYVVDDHAAGDWSKFLCLEPVSDWPNGRTLAPGGEYTLAAAIQSTMEENP